MQNSGVVAKICYYISSKKQKSSRSRRLQAPNGVSECRAGAKSRQNLRKVCGKLGRRHRERNGKYRSTPRVRFASRATGASPPALQSYIEIIGNERSLYGFQ